MDLLDLTYTSDGFVMNPGISSPIMGLDPASGLAVVMQRSKNIPTFIADLIYIWDSFDWNCADDSLCLRGGFVD